MKESKSLSTSRVECVSGIHDCVCFVLSLCDRAVLNIGTSAQVACLLPKGHKLPSAATPTPGSNNRPTANHVQGKADDAKAATAAVNGDSGAATSSSDSAQAELNLSASSQQPPSPDTCTRGDTTQCKSCQSTQSNDSNDGDKTSSSTSESGDATADLASRLSKVKLQKKKKKSPSTDSDDVVSAAAAVPPLECWPYFFNQRLAVAASLNGGNVLMSFVEMLQAWVAELCAVAPHTDDVFAHLITAGQRRIREGSLGRNDVIVVPRFFGERHRPQSRASVRELSPTSTSLGGIFTALCRGLVKNLNDMMPVSFLRECHVDCLVGTGTALLRNGVLQAAVVESYGMRVEAVPVDDATVGAAYGAALAAVDMAQSSSSLSSSPGNVSPSAPVPAASPAQESASSQ